MTHWPVPYLLPHFSDAQGTEVKEGDKIKIFYGEGDQEFYPGTVISCDTDADVEDGEYVDCSGMTVRIDGLQEEQDISLRRDGCSHDNSYQIEKIPDEG